MDAQQPEKPDNCLEETYKANLRIRLYRMTRDDGSMTHMITVEAWNSWAGQSKLISAVGGLEPQPAQALFHDLNADLSHYDWMEGRVVMEGETTPAEQ